MVEDEAGRSEMHMDSGGPKQRRRPLGVGHQAIGLTFEHDTDVDAPLGCGDERLFDTMVSDEVHVDVDRSLGRVDRVHEGCRPLFRLLDEDRIAPGDHREPARNRCCGCDGDRYPTPWRQRRARDHSTYEHSQRNG
jgi:hypothetical protein